MNLNLPENSELPPSGLTTLVVDSDDEHMRVDSYLVKHVPQFSRAKIQRSVARGRVTVDGLPAKSSTRLKLGQRVVFQSPPKSTDEQIPENIPIRIVLEDDEFVVIDKPAGMVVHPSKGHWAGTLTSALLYHFKSLSTIGGEARPGIVHRLDRDTSGLIIIAKTDESHSKLSQQFEARTVQKEYWTIVTPAPDRDRDLIDKPIGAHPYQREKKAIRLDHASGRPAQTTFEVVERFHGFAVVRVIPKTGRTHQIRVHMAHIGSPVLCDRLYSGRARIKLGELSGNPSDNNTVLLERQALHARKIKFAHPQTGELIECAAPLPEDLSRTLKGLMDFRKRKN